MKSAAGISHLNRSWFLTGQGKIQCERGLSAKLVYKISKADRSILDYNQKTLNDMPNDDVSISRTVAAAHASKRLGTELRG